jgi:selenocysteine lyase/cysteine desulfurase
MEAGTLNAVGIISLKYGIEHAFENFDRINNKISRLSEMFCEGLKNIGGIKIYSCANGIVLCNFSSLASGEAADILSEKYGICVRSGLHCAPLIHNYLGTIRNGALRFSFGENNCYFQVPIILAAMKKIALSAQSSNTIK